MYSRKTDKASAALGCSAFAIKEPNAICRAAILVDISDVREYLHYAAVYQVAVKVMRSIQCLAGRLGEDQLDRLQIRREAEVCANGSERAFLEGILHER